MTNTFNLISSRSTRVFKVLWYYFRGMALLHQSFWPNHDCQKGKFETNSPVKIFCLTFLKGRSIKLLKKWKKSNKIKSSNPTLISADHIKSNHPHLSTALQLKLKLKRKRLKSSIYKGRKYSSIKLRKNPKRQKKTFWLRDSKSQILTQFVCWARDLLEQLTWSDIK